jgi:hypothetical protein
MKIYKDLKDITSLEEFSPLYLKLCHYAKCLTTKHKDSKYLKYEILHEHHFKYFGFLSDSNGSSWFISGLFITGTRNDHRRYYYNDLLFLMIHKKK